MRIRQMALSLFLPFFSLTRASGTRRTRAHQSRLMDRNSTHADATRRQSFAFALGVCADDISALFMRRDMSFAHQFVTSNAGLLSSSYMTNTDSERQGVVLST